MIETYKIGESTLTFDSGKHQYFIDGERADGVTTALGVIDKSGALIHWAVNDNALAYVFGGGKYKFAPAILPGTLYDEVQLMQIRNEAKGMHQKKKVEAAGVGTLVHDWIEQHIKSQIANVPGPEMPVSITMQNAINAFKAWEAEHKVKYLFSEKKICHPKYNYAGTLDFEAVVDDELVIGDLKTSNAIYNEYRFQTSAYLEARAVESNQAYVARWCIRVGKDTQKDQNGLETVEFEAKRYGQNEHKKDFKTFLGALTIYRRLRELNKDKYARN